MTTRLPALLVGVLLLAACTKNDAPAAQNALALTHQWAVKRGTSLFVQVSLGTKPETAADGLMEVMPTAVHQLGEQCKSDPGAATAGSFSVSFTISGGAAKTPVADPPSALGECVVAALPSTLEPHAAKLASQDGTQLVLYLEHAPLGAP